MVFNPSAGADEALGPFSFFRLINILSMDASRQVSLKSIYWFQRRRYLKGFYHMSHLVGKPTMWFPNRSDTNWPVEAQKRARSLKFRL